MVLIMTETKAVETQAQPGDALWVNRDDAQSATGWEMKPEGLCKDDVCIPMPAGNEQEFARADELNLSGFWGLMGKPLAHSSDGDVWFLGDSAADHTAALTSLQAPDFTLPDFDGKPHSITDFRRKRVLLITWASW